MSETKLFRKVAIIGGGLIGSSLARAIRKHDIADTISIIDKNPDVCKRVLELGIADEATTEIKEGIISCGLVVIAVPVSAYAGVALEVGPNAEKGSIITDVGSVKGEVINKVKPHIKDGIHFVPAHPIAGTENSGPDAGFAELFEGRWCIITPLPDTDIRAVEKVTKLWEACGSTIELMDYKRHDLVLAITSHLPHLIAYTIVGTANDLEDDTKEEVIKFSASGFRDFTRIAASDPTMWRDVFLNNREAVLEILQRFNEDLTALQKAIRRGEGEYLFNAFSRTRDIRRQIIKAGQAEYNQATEQPESGSGKEDQARRSGSEG